MLFAANAMGNAQCLMLLLLLFRSAMARAFGRSSSGCSIARAARILEAKVECTPSTSLIGGLYRYVLHICPGQRRSGA
ncbi:hypothetical protein F5883DRAFT_542825 [Diaporthe sp. PMI_573]|nr:hypothetical protein F5883DRAFT_542825 [Diaporthaceae sp. PMI_573]